MKTIVTTYLAQILAAAILLDSATSMASAPASTKASVVSNKRVLTTGIAAFNMAWAGTAEEFKRHRAVCTSPSVNWCDTRARIERGATAPTDAERERAQKCADATLQAAGGREASMLLPPCSAYRSATPPVPGQTRPDLNLTRTESAYQQKLDSLSATVAALIEREAVKVIAFQEVSGSDVIKVVLGKYAGRFDVCAAKHNAFQTLAFAWDKSLSRKPGACETVASLAILDPANDPAAFRRVRPGLSLTLVINNAPVTFMNVHLKAGCASVNNSNERFPGRMLDEPFDACEVLNRQVPLIEGWLEVVAKKTPRFVMLGDFNRRIDDELAMAPAKDQVRRDGSDPASPNKPETNGRVSSKFLWQELSDGTPVMHQIPLTTTESSCSGFQGLDHIVISDALKKLNAGVIGSKKVGVVIAPNQQIETSDHCPRVAQVKF
jgi:endonuclease/exonuclease/phosphatase family metal-dependent hydrolase